MEKIIYKKLYTLPFCTIDNMIKKEYDIIDKETIKLHKNEIIFKMIKLWLNSNNLHKYKNLCIYYVDNKLTDYIEKLKMDIEYKIYDVKNNYYFIWINANYFITMFDHDIDNNLINGIKLIIKYIDRNNKEIIFVNDKKLFCLMNKNNKMQLNEYIIENNYYSDIKINLLMKKKNNTINYLDKEYKLENNE